MARYEYKVIPFVGQVKGVQSAAQASTQLQDEIESYAKQGWELYQMTDVNIEVAPGCLSALFGRKDAYIRVDQIILRRERQS